MIGTLRRLVYESDTAARIYQAIVGHLVAAGWGHPESMENLRLYCKEQALRHAEADLRTKDALEQLHASRLEVAQQRRAMGEEMDRQVDALKAELRPTKAALSQAQNAAINAGKHLDAMEAELAKTRAEAARLWQTVYNEFPINQNDRAAHFNPYVADVACATCGHSQQLHPLGGEGMCRECTDDVPSDQCFEFKPKETP